jgi:hypothetical protein
MIKLVVSDVDGTLLRNGEKVISEEVIDIIKEFKEQEIIFAVASGRPYTNLRKLFQPVKDDILYICENGALVVYKEQLISKTPLDRRTCFNLIDDISKTLGCEMLISGEETAYTIPKRLDFPKLMKDTGYEIEVIKTYRDVHEEIIQISAYNPKGIERDYEAFKKRWGKIIKVTKSQETWIDFNQMDVNKGNALAVVQHVFGVTEEDTMTFGDNHNDLEMFERSYFSYAMKDAAPEIRSAARYIAPDVATIMKDVTRM